MELIHMDAEACFDNTIPLASMAKAAETGRMTGNKTVEAGILPA
jgi:hypothetical protein